MYFRGLLFLLFLQASTSAILVSSAYSDTVLQRHHLGKTLGEASLAFSKALNWSAVQSLKHKHIRQQIPEITRLAKNNLQHGVLLEARIYKQKYGEAKMFWSAHVLGSGNTPIHVLAEYLKRPRIEGIPGDGWEYDTSSTVFYWYKLGKEGELHRKSIANTNALIHEVRQFLEKQEKIDAPERETRKRATEKEMERQLLLRKAKTKETADEIIHWLSIMGHHSVDEWAGEQLENTLRSHKILLHYSESRRIPLHRTHSSTNWSPHQPTEQEHIEVPLDLDAYQSLPQPETPTAHESIRPAILD